MWLSNCQTYDLLPLLSPEPLLPHHKPSNANPRSCRLLCKWQGLPCQLLTYVQSLQWSVFLFFRKLYISDFLYQLECKLHFLWLSNCQTYDLLPLLSPEPLLPHHKPSNANPRSCRLLCKWQGLPCQLLTYVQSLQWSVFLFFHKPYIFDFSYLLECKLHFLW